MTTRLEVSRRLAVGAGHLHQAVLIRRTGGSVARIRESVGARRDGGQSFHLKARLISV